jgi:hypothetical protein
MNIEALEIQFDHERGFLPKKSLCEYLEHVSAVNGCRRLDVESLTFTSDTSIFDFSAPRFPGPGDGHDTPGAKVVDETYGRITMYETEM